MWATMMEDSHLRIAVRIVPLSAKTGYDRAKSQHWIL
jgi:hypothetical protein